MSEKTQTGHKTVAGGKTLPYIEIQKITNLLHLNSEMCIKYPLNCFAIDMHGYYKMCTPLLMYR